MADNQPRNIEHGPQTEAVKPTVESKSTVKENKDVRATAEQVLSAGKVEGNEGNEDVESGMGRVSEEASEDKSKAGQGAKGQLSTDQIEAIRAKLLAALPPQEVMISQIKSKLYKRERVLTKRMNSLQKKAHLNAFHLNIVVSQLRKVREYFSMLAHATYELVKTLWLKIVHGV